MRICYLCADPGVALVRRNGSARHVRSVVQALSRAGHRVDVLAASVAGADELGVLVREIPAPGLARDLLEPGRSRSDRAVARALRHVLNNAAVEWALERRLAGEPRPQLVYERYAPFHAAGARTCRRAGVPHVLEVNAPLAWEGAHHRGQALTEAAALLEREALDGTSRIIAVSEELRDQLVESGTPASKIDVVPNGVDVEEFTAAGPAQRPVPAGALVVGFVGSLKPWHGIEILIEAFRGLAAEDASYHLSIVGDGPLGGAVRSLQDELPGRVTWAGAVAASEVPAWLRGMDVAVAPYPALERFYFSPLKVLESMACGCAVIASRIGQPARLIRHMETGLLVPPGDAASLAAAVRRLAADPQLRRQLGRQAAVETHELHAWDQRVETIAELATCVA